jgi:hypothetical protein
MRFAAAATLLLTFILPLAASAQGAPKFVDYPAKVYRGRNAKVRLDTPQAQTFRTRLKEAARQRPNFAGHYVLVTWGCGTQCQSGAVVDVLSGMVTFLPGSLCCWSGSDDPVYYRADSRLIVFAGMLDEEGVNGAHFFVIDGSGFRRVATIAKEPEKPVDDDKSPADTGSNAVTVASDSALTARKDFAPPEPRDPDNVCGGRAAMFAVEEAGYDPPEDIMPDVGAEGETPQLEWNDLGSRANGLRVLCYSERDAKAHAVYSLPKDVDRCRFLNGIASCTSAEQRTRAALDVIKADPDVDTLRQCLNVGLARALLVISKQSSGDPDFYAKVLALGGLATIGENVRRVCNDGYTEATGVAVEDKARAVNNLFVAGLLDAERDFFTKCGSHAGDPEWAETSAACAVLSEKSKLTAGK